MHTSYYKKIDKLIQLGYKNFVSIAGKTPEWLNLDDKRIRVFKTLAPKYEWWKQWRDKKLSDQFYIQKYYETVLNNLDPKQIVKQLGEDAILLCYENSDKFCHRHVVAKWLNDNLGINVDEI